MDFSILGPVEATEDGRQIPLGGPRQRALFARLVIDANHVVSSDRLVADLWEVPPHDAHAALQTQVSRLRKALGDRLVTKPPGYLLQVAPGEVDLDRFRAGVAEAGGVADAHERSRILREADSLFLGTPLADVEAPFVVVDRAALEELRLAALEGRVDADLERGRHAELVSELGTLVQEHPFREPLRAQLILALYRSGRQAEALAAYRETRRVLDEELGLEPSPALRELERAILRHDPALALAPVTRPEVSPGVAPRPRSRAPLVVAAALGLAAAGAGAAVVVTSSGGHSKLAAPTRRTLVIRKAVAGRHGQSRPQHAHQATRATHRLKDAAIPAAARVHARTTTHDPPAATTTLVTTVASAPVRKPAKAPVESVAQAPTTTVRTRAGSLPKSVPGKPPAKPVTISDNFKGDQFDGTIWYPIRFGTGWTMTEQGGHLEFAFSPATAGSTPDGDYGGHVGTLCKFPGDVDARVNFTLSDWPPGNGITVLLYLFLGPTNIGWAVNRRSSAQWGEQFGSWTGIATSVQLNDTSGTLRIARRKGVVTAYFLHNGRWQALTSGVNTNLATIGVSAIGGPGYNIGPFGGHQVVVDFDNFSVTGVSPICPPGAQSGS